MSIDNKNTSTVKKNIQTRSSNRFSLQIATSMQKTLNIDMSIVDNQKELFVSKEENVYIYYIGYYENLVDANLDRIKLNDAGYKGAFITKKTFPETTEKTLKKKANTTHNLISY